uniref:Uncharacterized protein n=1 Tax=Anguilla anguilla TaxID=7936 RepID=A0A0E9W7N7_ANGAN
MNFDFQRLRREIDPKLLPFFCLRFYICRG